MQRKDIEGLLIKYNAGLANPEERALVETWYLKYNNPNSPDLSHQQFEQDQKEILDKLMVQIKGESKIALWPRLAIAASILVFLTAGIYLLHLNKVPQRPVAVSKIMKDDVAPGGNKATLTLGDGHTIVLKGTQTGDIASQGDMVIKETANGQIRYASSNGNSVSKSLVYNTATTPRGGQYRFVLSDGTKIWLNSASSIKYPVEFIGKERKVELDGEAYFEVAHNSKMPFKVVSNGQTVEVLGTHFNINAYSDENMVKTTLLEGSVKISSANNSTLIKPGEQAQLANGKLNVVNADMDEVMAWKNGFFFFKDNSLEDVMRQLARWYNVDVKYEGAIPARTFSGEIPRNINLSQLWDILSYKNIHYKIDGKTIIVMK